MTRRIRIKLTSASWEPSGWRWRAADAQEPKGFIPTALVPHGAAVNDVLTVEISSQWEGSEVLRVISPDRTSAADSATATDRPRPSRKKKQRKSRSSTRAANVTALARVRELAWQGRIEEAIALCEERGWDPGKTDARLRNKETNQTPVSTPKAAPSSREVDEPRVVSKRTARAESAAQPTFEFRRLESGIAVSQGSVSGPAFFDVKNQKGDLEIRISDSHPSFPLLLSELDPSAQSVLLMVLQSWAQMESDAVGTARQIEIEDARLEWGRHLRHLLLRLQDQA